MKRMITLAAMALMVAGAAMAGDYTEVFDQTYSVDHGAIVGLENINGDVTVEVWDQPEIRVNGVKSASSQERLELLVIKVRQSARGVFVETDYPDSRDLSYDDRRGRSKVEYTLTVPRHAAIDGIDLINGDLLITGVEGGIDADTINGTIVVSGVAGEIELETVNGGIEVELGSQLMDDVSLSSVNGAIDVFTVGSADVSAETVNGRISNDFGIHVQKGKYVGSSMNGEIGGGGPSIDMETVNGRIFIGSR